MRRALPIAVSLAVFIGTFAIRVRGISQHFWLLQDQIRDWGIALQPFSQLPLVGSPTHVGGYTIGPAFYWILWLIRVLVGPWFQNLPHAGGIGQALLQSGADVLLFVAIWKRTGSVWPALTTIVILATAPFDLSLAAVIWNPVVGAILSKAAIALVLLGWPRASDVRGAIVTAIAWGAVHAYTGAIFAALGVFAAMAVQALMEQGPRAAIRRVLLIAGVVALLQTPYIVHQLEQRSEGGGMDAVADSVSRVITGRDSTRFRVSAATYADAFNSIEIAPWVVPAPGWILVACAVALTIGYRRDPVLIVVTLLPQVLAIAGYAFWVDFLDSYYYLPILPAAVLTVVLGITACIPRRARPVGSIAMLVCALAAAPSRVAAAHLFDMPAYRGLVKASRALVSMGRPMRAIETRVPFERPADPSFIYRILGGTLDAASPWVAVIQPDGGVELRRAGP